MELVFWLVLITLISTGLLKAYVYYTDNFFQEELEDEEVAPAPILLGDEVDPDTDALTPLLVEVKQLRPHALISGETQMGKSRETAALLLQKIDRGEQVIVLDPHGGVFNYLRSKLLQRGVFNDPSKKDKIWFVDLPEASVQGLYPTFDILDRDLPLHTTAIGFLEAVHRVWPELEKSSALDNVVPHSCALLIHHKLPITLLPSVLSSTGLNTKNPLLEALLLDFPDKEVVDYWRQEFGKMNKDEQHKETASTRRRIWRLNFEPEVRYSLINKGTPNLANFRAIFENKTSVIINLHFPNDVTTKLWGALLMVAIEQAVKSRLGIPRDPHDHCTVFVDEFPLFVSKENSEEGLNSFLQRTLGAGISLWLCHQTLSTVPESMLEGTLDLCALRIAFRLGPDDAKYAASRFFHFDPHLVKETIRGQGMPRHTFYSVDEQRAEHQKVFQLLRFREALIKLPNDAQPYTIETPYLPDVQVDEQQLRDLKQHYLATLFRPQGEIEQQLEQRINNVHIATKNDTIANHAAETAPERAKTQRTRAHQANVTIKPDAPPPPSPAQSPDLDDDDELQFITPA